MKEEKRNNCCDFDCVAYAFTFDFCTMEEKARLMRTLFKAWRWGTRINTKSMKKDGHK